MAHRWTRDLHLYLGLFISPFILLFAVSVWFLNHAKVDTGAWTSIEAYRDLQLPPGLDAAEGPAAVAFARDLLPRLDVEGEVGFTRFVGATGHFVFPVSKPGIEVSVDVDTALRTATVSRRRTGLLEAIATLHKLPGPHNVNIRGNWIGTRLWRWFADATVIVALFLTFSGLYLWLALKAERRVGLVLIAAGALSVFGVMYAIVQ